MSKINTRNRDEYKGSSEHLKKKKDLHEVIQIRLKIFIFILVLLSGLLIYRLYMIQIKNHDHYQLLLDKSKVPFVSVDTMRGEFMDRNGRVITSNKSINSIVYYSNETLKKDERWKLAENFVDNFNFESKLHENDLIELWLFLNNNGEELITEEENLEFKKGDLTQEDLDYLKKQRIDQKMLDSLTEKEKKVFQVYHAMTGNNINQASLVLEDASNDQIAFLSENNHLFPGFTFMTSWEREHNKEIDFKSIIGSVGEIPVEKLDYYLAQGYRRNDLVGSYGLEYEYEELLSGVKSKYEKDPLHNQLNKIEEGRKGYDLQLSIDIELQKKTEQILEDILESNKNESRRAPFKTMHMVASDPKTGDILSMAAITRDKKGNYYNDPQALMLSAYPVGSTVKGATVYAGLDSGVMKKGEIVNDAPMHISGTPPRHSFRNLGPVDDISSLKLSSNIYMFHVAIRLGGSQYIPNGPLVFKNPAETYDHFRSYFSQFGLGVKTQIDFPRESLGYKGDTTNSGALLEYSIGQFDNYNAMQLNQYITTIANGGYRLKPRLVTHAVNKDNLAVVYENQVHILNELENKDALSRVQEGMRQCVTTSNCGPLASKNFTSAAKTGTAQDYMAEYEGIVRHNAFVAYAPFEDPEIAISCIAPYTYLEAGGYAMTNLCTIAGDQLIDYYMNSE